MAKFPVEISDTEGIVDAVNNLLSGPSGLGQNFAGYSSYTPAYLTGNYRTPFTWQSFRSLYVAPISLATSEFVDSRTLKFTFASAQPLAPFRPGNQINISDVTDGNSNPSEYTYSGIKAVLGSDTTYTGISPTTLTGTGSGLIVDVTLSSSGAVAYDGNNTSIAINTNGGNYAVGDTLLILGTDLGGISPANDLTLTVVHTSGAWYDGYYTTIGVVSCTTTECFVRLSKDYAIEPIGYGGTIGLNTMDTALSTDCNARVTVTGGTDRVFISGQLDQTVSYEVTSGTQDLTVFIQVNRYAGFLNDDPVNPDYLFNLDGTVAEKEYTFTGLSGIGTLPLIETVYSTLLDTPNPGYYWYILEVTYTGTDIFVTDSKFGLRSLSTQVVKQ